MALGGGTFTTMTKVMPGAYINFVSVSNAASLLSGRGVVCMPLVLDWAPEGMFQIDQEDFLDDARPLFGYRATDAKLKPLYDLFLHAKTLYAYNVASGSAVASCDLCAAKYAGERGNDLSVAVAETTDNKYVVTTYLGAAVVDEQTVSKSEELEDNAYVVWTEGTSLGALTKTALTGGSTGSATTDTYDAFLDAAEGVDFNILACDTTDTSVRDVIVEYTKTQRDTEGKKFQAVLYNAPADHEGIINVSNTVTDEGASEAALVYWTAGAEASCQVQESLLNTVYDGKYTIKVSTTQTDLKNAIANGMFVFHKVGTATRVLYDINSLVSTTADKGDVFKDNKTIRVIDEIANDIASIFITNYLGRIPNDEDGRLAFWNDIVDNHKALAKKRAIQNFDSADVVVSVGDNKNDVVVTDAVEVTGTMAKLYMTVVVS